MSRRYELVGPDAPTELVDAADLDVFEPDEQPPGWHALVIGDPWASALAVLGTRDDLAEFVRDLAELVEPAQPVRRQVTRTSVRRTLHLSTVHLPPATRANLGGVPGVTADPLPHCYGWLMWVPDDPRESAKWQAPPRWALAIQRYARALGCDHVRFERDSDEAPGLRRWDDG